MILAMGVAGGLLSLITPLATGALFNDIIPGAARPQLLQLTVVLLVIAVTNTMFSIASGTALVRLEVKMGGAVQAGVWDRLLSLPIPFFRPFNAGNLAQRAMGIDAIRQVLSGATVSALLGGLFSIFHFGLLFYYSPKLAAWAAVLVAIALSAALVGGALQTRWERQVTGVRNRLAGSVLQFLTSIAKLRVAAAESQAFVIWARQFGHQRQLQFRSRAVGNLLATFQASFPLVATLILYALALPLLSGGPGALRTGDFLAFMASFGICMGGLLSACGALVTAAMVVPLYEQARPILQAAPEVDVARSDPGVLTGEIDVEHLSFRYGADGPMVLRDIRVRIAAGQYVAFVGPSGSGKSTLFRLLLGFEQPDSGGIYYDGQELSGLDIQAVRRQIGVVLQNGRLMSGDLFTNIVGSSSATLDEAWEAAAMAGFDEDIRKMPMGMHTVVSEGGGTLSGGQRQRLMIARAIVQKPRVLFFDEATSALDNRTQAIVSESLERLRATRVVIAHRLSTILNADQIYVMQGGRVVQHGTYRELVEQEGLFAELARRQLA
jgi:ATP-binding cassette subfamily C protein